IARYMLRGEHVHDSFGLLLLRVALLEASDATRARTIAGQTERRLMKAAIVTLAIGDAYLNRRRAYCEPGWSRYAKRHDFEVIVRPLDQTPRAAARSPAWQKCLVLRPDIAGSFDRIIWIDSDVLINDRRALSSIAEGVPLGKIGATDACVFPSREARRQVLMA